MSLGVGESSEVFIALLENFSLFFVELKYGFFYGNSVFRRYNWQGIVDVWFVVDGARQLPFLKLVVHVRLYH